MGSTLSIDILPYTNFEKYKAELDKLAPIMSQSKYRRIYDDLCFKKHALSTSLSCKDDKSICQLFVSALKKSIIPSIAAFLIPVSSLRYVDNRIMPYMVAPISAKEVCMRNSFSEYGANCSARLRPLLDEQFNVATSLKRLFCEFMETYYMVFSAFMIKSSVNIIANEMSFRNMAELDKCILYTFDFLDK